MAFNVPGISNRLPDITTEISSLKMFSVSSYSYSRVNNGLVTLGVSGQQPKARTGRYGPRDEVAATLSRL